MQADKNILQLKYEIIINMLAEKLNISKDDALEIFYNSKTYETMNEGIGDMHCMSEYFIRDEIVDEIKNKK